MATKRSINNKPITQIPSSNVRSNISNLHTGIQQLWRWILKLKEDVESVQKILSATLSASILTNILSDMKEDDLTLHPLLTNDGQNIKDLNDKYVVIDNGS